MVKAASLAEIKKELQQRPPEELLALCLRLGRFKKENKELLTYLLFEADDEDEYVRQVNAHITELFEGIRRDHAYYARKSSRRILKEVKKYARYSNAKETEVSLLICYCSNLGELMSGLPQSKAMDNLYSRQLALVEKRMESLHPDLQYDFRIQLEELGL